MQARRLQIADAQKDVSLSEKRHEVSFLDSVDGDREDGALGGLRGTSRHGNQKA
jgi:hypothetical protein